MGVFTMKKVILTCALTGGIHGKAANPNLPEQPDEIIQQGIEAAEAGATVLHIHARSPEGKPTTDVEILKYISENIKAKSDVIVQLTTGGGLGVSVEDRLKVLDLKPEMASLNMSNAVFLFGGQEFFFQNFRSEIEFYAKKMMELGIIPEYECYSLESIYDVEYLISKGLAPKPYYINICLGIPAQGAIRATPKNLMLMIDALPEGAVFNVTAAGPAQLPLTTMTALMGGHCRVGMEDNVYYSKGVLVENNAQLVKRSLRILKELNLEVATPAEAREFFNIKQ
jgi:3-keto-5-aminohexanoate cleavage enzyme